MTKAESVVLALKAALAGGVPAATVKRADGWPTRLDGGRMILIFEDRDTNPDEMLGTEGPWYVEHPIVLGLAVEAGTADARDAGFDALLAEVDAVLSADLTLGGAIFGMTYARPSIEAEAFPGAAGIKAAVLEVTVEYQSDTRL